MKDVMKALVKRDLTQAGVSLQEVPVPSPGPAQLRVAVAATGICGTDLHIMDDEYAVSMPVVMGHEVTGIVDAVGAGVASGWVGRRVAIETYFSTCEACYYCREGQRNLCAGRQSIGTHVNGGFAEYVIVPAVNAHEVHQSVSRFAGGLYEPLSCVAARPVRRLRSFTRGRGGGIRPRCHGPIGCSGVSRRRSERHGGWAGQ